MQAERWLAAGEIGGGAKRESGGEAG